MEFVDGPTAEMYLRDALLRGDKGLSERTALDICIAAARGLDAAHSNGVIHRDIKPDNIIIPRHKSINPGTLSPNRLSFQNSKLTDLGLARHETCSLNMTRVNVCMGTPGFMAPEQAQDARRAGKPADVFSLGATLYCLLTGDAPFTGEDMNQVLHATFTLPHDPVRIRRPDISAPTAALLDMCLAKKPKERLSSATALLRELCACRRHVLIERGKTKKIER
jgi:serine/threonine protein kinase